MNQILRMQNVVQPYAWGSRHALAHFMGDSSDDVTPRAEIWMGAHPKAPSRVWLEASWQSLDAVIAADPKAILGAHTNLHFDGQLPYLFKVLAADQPLSIQVHPTRKQAREGFEEEDARGIPLTAEHRNFKDKNHKPECICALTPFWGVCGFRPFREMMPLLKAVWPAQENPHLKDSGVYLALPAEPQDLANFFSRLMTQTTSSRQHLIRQVIAKARPLAASHAAFEWVLRLHEHYPGDAGILSPIILNLFRLQPGEAIYLAAGQLHAYFCGMGIEIMANSDNVLRGGLTPKHVDVPQLLKVLDFHAAAPAILKPYAVGDHEDRYPCPAEEFCLSQLHIDTSGPYEACNDDRRSAEILLCTDGSAEIFARTHPETLSLTKGQSVFVPASVSSYRISGHATIYMAGANPDVFKT